MAAAVNSQDQVDDQESVQGARFSLAEQRPGSPRHTAHPRPTWREREGNGLDTCPEETGWVLGTFPTPTPDVCSLTIMRP